MTRTTSTLADQVGSTPLQLASGHDRYEVVQVLLEYGADVTIRDKVGR